MSNDITLSPAVPEPPRPLIVATPVAQPKNAEEIVNSILGRPDIAPLVADLAVDPRPVGEPLTRLRTNQAHLLKALSGLKDAHDFNILAGNQSQHIQAVLTALTNKKPDEVTKEIRGALKNIEADKAGAQGGKPRILPSVDAILKRKRNHDFGDAALYAEEASTRFSLFNLIRHAATSGDPKVEKEAAKQAKNLQKTHAKMMQKNTEGMHKRLKQSKEDIDKWIESLTGLVVLKEALSGITQAISNFFRRMSPKGN